MADNKTTATDETYSVAEPTDTFHGLQVVNHDGTAFIEQIDNDGNEVQSIMVSDPVEQEKLIDALTRVTEGEEE